MQLAMRNYIRAFKWQNIKESYHNGSWFSLLYIGIMLPLILNGWKMDEAGISILILFPNIFAMFTVLYPMALPKLMYLCPMSKDMLKEYIISACRIRTGVPILLTILVLIIFLFLGLIDWVSALGMLLNNTVFALFLGSGTNAKGYGDIDQRGYRSIPLNTAFSVCEGVIILSCMLLTVGYCAVDITDPMWVKLLLLIITLLIPVPVTRYYLKFWPGSVENALCYENTMKQPIILRK